MTISDKLYIIYHSWVFSMHASKVVNLFQINVKLAAGAAAAPSGV